MALTDNLADAKAAMVLAMEDKLDDLVLLPVGLTPEQQAAIVAMRHNLLVSVAEMLGPLVAHLTANAEIGSALDPIVSTVAGSTATQDAPYTGLLH